MLVYFTIKIHERKIPAFKIGRHWRVKKSDLGEFIE
nr:helix-turn-helix domain-containing protein [Fictibacillus nanhaiensis]